MSLSPSSSTCPFAPSAVSLPDGFSCVLNPALRWQHFSEIDSTNAYLLAQASTQQLVSADVQTQGRGRHQQRWVDEGSSALFSLSCQRPAGVDISAWPVQVALTLSESFNTLLAHFSSRDATATHFPKPSVNIKWPNDLYIQQQGQWGKFAGILIESTVMPSQALPKSSPRGKVVTGVGVNLAPLQQTISKDYPATFIDLPLDKMTLIPLLVNRLWLAWQQFIMHPYIDVVAYQRVDYLFEREIVATNMHSGSELRGIGGGINACGHLRLYQDGVEQLLTSQQRIRFADE